MTHWGQNHWDSPPLCLINKPLSVKDELCQSQAISQFSSDSYVCSSVIIQTPFDLYPSDESQPLCMHVLYICETVCVQTSALQLKNNRRDLHTVPRPIYLMHSGINGIFLPVTSGISYHLFTMCTLLWILSRFCPKPQPLQLWPNTTRQFIRLIRLCKVLSPWANSHPL